MTSRIARIAVAVIGAMAITAVTALSAKADTPTDDPVKIVQAGSYNQLNYSTPVVGLYPTADTPLSTGVIGGFARRTITPPNGKAGTFNVGFYSSYNTWCKLFLPTCYISVHHGTSSTHWLGNVPWNATSMSLTDKIWANGISISVSFPPGIGITTNGNTWQWTTSRSKTWQLAHSFYSIGFSSPGPIWGPWESATGEATFSWQSFQISAHS